MAHEVEWTNKARRDFRKLSIANQDRIEDAINLLAEEGRGDVKKMQGEENSYRLRVGQYRAIFSFDQREEEGPPTIVVDIILINKIRNRGEAYGKK